MQNNNNNNNVLSAADIASQHYTKFRLPRRYLIHPTSHPSLFNFKTTNNQQQQQKLQNGWVIACQIAANDLYNNVINSRTLASNKFESICIDIGDHHMYHNTRITTSIDILQFVVEPLLLKFPLNNLERQAYPNYISILAYVALQLEQYEFVMVLQTYYGIFLPLDAIFDLLYLGNHNNSNNNNNNNNNIAMWNHPGDTFGSKLFQMMESISNTAISTNNNPTLKSSLWNTQCNVLSNILTSPPIIDVQSVSQPQQQLESTQTQKPLLFSFKSLFVYNNISAILSQIFSTAIALRYALESFDFISPIKYEEQSTTTNQKDEQQNNTTSNRRLGGSAAYKNAGPQNSALLARFGGAGRSIVKTVNTNSTSSSTTTTPIPSSNTDNNITTSKTITNHITQTPLFTQTFNITHLSPQQNQQQIHYILDILIYWAVHYPKLNNIPTQYSNNSNHTGTSLGGFHITDLYGFPIIQIETNSNSLQQTNTTTTSSTISKLARPQITSYGGTPLAGQAVRTSNDSDNNRFPRIHNSDKFEGVRQITFPLYQVPYKIQPRQQEQHSQQPSLLLHLQTVPQKQDKSNFQNNANIISLPQFLMSYEYAIQPFYAHVNLSTAAHISTLWENELSDEMEKIKKLFLPIMDNTKSITSQFQQQTTTTLKDQQNVDALSSGPSFSIAELFYIIYKSLYGQQIYNSAIKYLYSAIFILYSRQSGVPRSVLSDKQLNSGLKNLPKQQFYEEQFKFYLDCIIPPQKAMNVVSNMDMAEDESCDVIETIDNGSTDDNTWFGKILDIHQRYYFPLVAPAINVEESQNGNNNTTNILQQSNYSSNISINENDNNINTNEQHNLITLPPPTPAALEWMKYNALNTTVFGSKQGYSELDVLNSKHYNLLLDLAFPTKQNITHKHPGCHHVVPFLTDLESGKILTGHKKTTISNIQHNGTNKNNNNNNINTDLTKSAATTAAATKSTTSPCVAFSFIQRIIAPYYNKITISSCHKQPTIFQPASSSTTTTTKPLNTGYQKTPITTLMKTTYGTQYGMHELQGHFFQRSIPHLRNTDNVFNFLLQHQEVLPAIPLLPSQCLKRYERDIIPILNNNDDSNNNKNNYYYKDFTILSFYHNIIKYFISSAKKPTIAITIWLCFAYAIQHFYYGLIHHSLTYYKLTTYQTLILTNLFLYRTIFFPNVLPHALQYHNNTVLMDYEEEIRYVLLYNTKHITHSTIYITARDYCAGLVGFSGVIPGISDGLPLWIGFNGDNSKTHLPQYLIDDNKSIQTARQYPQDLSIVQYIMVNTAQLIQNTPSTYHNSILFDFIRTFYWFLSSPRMIMLNLPAHDLPQQHAQHGAWTSTTRATENAMVKYRQCLTSLNYFSNHALNYPILFNNYLFTKYGLSEAHRLSDWKHLNDNMLFRDFVDVTLGVKGKNVVVTQLYSNIVLFFMILQTALGTQLYTTTATNCINNIMKQNNEINFCLDICNQQKREISILNNNIQTDYNQRTKVLEQHNTHVINTQKDMQLLQGSIAIFLSKVLQFCLSEQHKSIVFAHIFSIYSSSLLFKDFTISSSDTSDERDANNHSNNSSDDIKNDMEHNNIGKNNLSYSYYKPLMKQLVQNPRAFAPRAEGKITATSFEPYYYNITGTGVDLSDFWDMIKKTRFAYSLANNYYQTLIRSTITTLNDTSCSIDNTIDKSNLNQQQQQDTKINFPNFNITPHHIAMLQMAIQLGFTNMYIATNYTSYPYPKQFNDLFASKITTTNTATTGKQTIQQQFKALPSRVVNPIKTEELVLNSNFSKICDGYGVNVFHDVFSNDKHNTDYTGLLHHNETDYHALDSNSSNNEFLNNNNNNNSSVMMNDIEINHKFALTETTPTQHNLLLLKRRMRGVLQSGDRDGMLALVPIFAAIANNHDVQYDNSSFTSQHQLVTLLSGKVQQRKTNDEKDKNIMTIFPNAQVLFRFATSHFAYSSYNRVQLPHGVILSAIPHFNQMGWDRMNYLHMLTSYQDNIVDKYKVYTFDINNKNKNNNIKYETQLLTHSNNVTTTTPTNSNCNDIINDQEKEYDILLLTKQLKMMQFCKVLDQLGDTIFPPRSPLGGVELHPYMMLPSDSFLNNNIIQKQQQQQNNANTTSSITQQWYNHFMKFIEKSFEYHQQHEERNTPSTTDQQDQNNNNNNNTNIMIPTTNAIDDIISEIAILLCLTTQTSTQQHQQQQQEKQQHKDKPTLPDIVTVLRVHYLFWLKLFSSTTLLLDSDLKQQIIHYIFHVLIQVDTLLIQLGQTIQYLCELNLLSHHEFTQYCSVLQYVLHKPLFDADNECCVELINTTTTTQKTDNLPLLTTSSTIAKSLANTIIGYTTILPPQLPNTYATTLQHALFSLAESIFEQKWKFICQFQYMYKKELQIFLKLVKDLNLTPEELQYLLEQCEFVIDRFQGVDNNSSIPDSNENDMNGDDQDYDDDDDDDDDSTDIDGDDNDDADDDDIVPDDENEKEKNIQEQTLQTCDVNINDFTLSIEAQYGNINKLIQNVILPLMLQMRQETEYDAFFTNILNVGEISQFILYYITNELYQDKKSLFKTNSINNQQRQVQTYNPNPITQLNYCEFWLLVLIFSPFLIHHVLQYYWANVQIIQNKAELYYKDQSLNTLDVINNHHNIDDNGMHESDHIQQQEQQEDDKQTQQQSISQLEKLNLYFKSELQWSVGIDVLLWLEEQKKLLWAFCFIEVLKTSSTLQYYHIYWNNYKIQCQHHISSHILWASLPKQTASLLFDQHDALHVVFTPITFSAVVTNAIGSTNNNTSDNTINAANLANTSHNLQYIQNFEEFLYTLNYLYQQRFYAGIYNSFNISPGGSDTGGLMRLNDDNEKYQDGMKDNKKDEIITTTTSQQDVNLSSKHHQQQQIVGLLQLTQQIPSIPTAIYQIDSSITSFEHIYYADKTKNDYSFEDWNDICNVINNDSEGTHSFSDRSDDFYGGDGSLDENVMSDDILLPGSGQVYDDNNYNDILLQESNIYHQLHTHAISYNKQLKYEQEQKQKQQLEEQQTQQLDSTNTTTITSIFDEVPVTFDSTDMTLQSATSMKTSESSKKEKLINKITKRKGPNFLSLYHQQIKFPRLAKQYATVGLLYFYIESIPNPCLDDIWCLMKGIEFDMTNISNITTNFKHNQTVINSSNAPNPQSTALQRSRTAIMAQYEKNPHINHPSIDFLDNTGFIFNLFKTYYDQHITHTNDSLSFNDTLQSYAPDLAIQYQNIIKSNTNNQQLQQSSLSRQLSSSSASSSSMAQQQEHQQQELYLYDQLFNTNNNNNNCYDNFTTEQTIGTKSMLLYPTDVIHNEYIAPSYFTTVIANQNNNKHSQQHTHRISYQYNINNIRISDDNDTAYYNHHENNDYFIDETTTINTIPQKQKEEHNKKQQEQEFAQNPNILIVIFIKALLRKVDAHIITFLLNWIQQCGQYDSLLKFTITINTTMLFPTHTNIIDHTKQNTNNNNITGINNLGSNIALQPRYQLKLIHLFEIVGLHYFMDLLPSTNGNYTIPQISYCSSTPSDIIGNTDAKQANDECKKIFNLNMIYHNQSYGFKYLQQYFKSIISRNTSYDGTEDVLSQTLEEQPY